MMRQARVKPAQVLGHGQPARRRRRRSSRRIRPLSRSWSYPSRCSSPCNASRRHLLLLGQTGGPRLARRPARGDHDVAQEPTRPGPMTADTGSAAKESTSVTVSIARNRRLRSRILRSPTRATATTPAAARGATPASHVGNAPAGFRRPRPVGHRHSGAGARVGGRDGVGVVSRHVAGARGDRPRSPTAVYPCRPHRLGRSSARAGAAPRHDRRTA